MRRQSQCAEEGASSSSTRPTKVRKTRRTEDAPENIASTAPVEGGGGGGSEGNDLVFWDPHGVTVPIQDDENTVLRNGDTNRTSITNGASNDGNGSQGIEGRSCENCRRCKLKCSRSKPCSKCILKGVTCVYEQPDKKRGPRPGYIEEINRRIDALEHIVLGQSLMRARDSRSPVPNTLQEAVEHERDRLDSLRVNYQTSQTLSQAPQVHIQHPSRPRRLSFSSKAASHPSPNSLATSHDNRPGRTNSALAFDPDLSRESLRQICEVYYHQIQPWLPFFRQVEVVALAMQSGDPRKHPDPVLQAVVAGASPYDVDLPLDHQRGFSWLQEYGSSMILRAASLDNLRITLLLQFLLFGNGRIADFWGLVTYPAQVATRAGLHLEDHHLNHEHRHFRRMIGFHEFSQTWVGKETVRRLFWCIFLQDQFAALLSGSSPSFDVTTIRRLLPCDGQHWQDDHPIHTHEFVPASIAIQVQVFSGSNIGGFAYLIEATEVQAMVLAFLNRFRDRKSPKQDVRSSLQEFLNLDIILTNWKAKLPVRYQQASYDDNGYMDHNITLAHLTHNTTGILLYQWPYALWGINTVGSDVQTSLFSQVLVVKQAAKEIAKICTRFLLHRRYLVSPQFSFCIFMAARALSAYSHWMMEPLDEDFDTLYSSLSESAKRWNGKGTSHGHKNKSSSFSNLADSLQSRLTFDKKRPGAINLATPCVELLREVTWDDESGIGETPTTPQFGSSHVVEPGEVAAMAPGGTVPQLGTVMEGTGDAAQVAGMDVGSYMQSNHDFERAMSILASTQTGGLDTRIFSWHDSPEVGKEMAPPPTTNQLL